MSACAKSPAARERSELALRIEVSTRAKRVVAPRYALGGIQIDASVSGYPIGR
jgi:hypothetical protein